MIQRIQTLYLLIASILVIVCLVLRLEWIDALLAVAAIISAVTIFLYRKRIVQAHLCVVTLGCILAWYIALAVLEGVAGIAESLPMVSALLVFLARKSILRDEKLVRSLDRIR